MSAGKGDKTRPYNPETFGKNYYNIFRKKDNMNEIIIESLAKLEKHIFSRVSGELIWDALIPKVKSPEDSNKLEHAVIKNKTSECHVKFNYQNEIAHVRSPYIPMQTIDSAESLSKCLGEATETLLMALKWMQHRRLEEVFERTSGGIITCDGTHRIKPFAHGDDVTSVDPGTITHGLTDEDLDAAWNRISSIASADEAYGCRLGIPQHAFVAGLIDGLSAGLKPSHVDQKMDSALPLRRPFKTLGNMIHLVSFLPPRYTEVDGKLIRVEFIKDNGDHNPEYGAAEFEVAYALHKSAMEYQVPSDDPENYLADLKWLADTDGKGSILATMTGAMRPRNAGAAITMIFRRA